MKSIKRKILSFDFVHKVYVLAYLLLILVCVINIKDNIKVKIMVNMMILYSIAHIYMIVNRKYIEYIYDLNGRLRKRLKNKKILKCMNGLLGVMGSTIGIALNKLFRMVYWLGEFKNNVILYVFMLFNIMIFSITVVSIIYVQLETTCYKKKCKVFIITLTVLIIFIVSIISLVFTDVIYTYYKINNNNVFILLYIYLVVMIALVSGNKYIYDYK